MEWREVRRRQSSPTREEHRPSSRWGCAQGRARLSWKAIQGFEVRPGRPPSGHRRGDFTGTVVRYPGGSWLGSTRM